jgi:acetyl-CoA acyltransferase
LGATGAKLTAQVIYHMRDNNLKYGIVTMCIGGGMGAAGLYENLQYKG